MKLSELLKENVASKFDQDVSGLEIDSRKIKPGYAFIALQGSNLHGMAFIHQAIENGAIAIIFDPAEAIPSVLTELTIASIAVTNLKNQLGEIAARFYDYPSRKLNVIGITGTNGKTSCSHLIAQSLEQCGVIGTLGWGDVGHLLPTINTTPDALSVQSLLAELVQQQKKFVAMEVSSHGLAQGRVNAVEFTGGIFTNLSRDHLDYHADMEAYFQAKLLLFTNPSLQFAVLNADDPHSLFIRKTLALNVQCWTYSIKIPCLLGGKHLFADTIRFTSDGVYFVAHLDQQKMPAFAPLAGIFNLENILAVLTTLLALGTEFAVAIQKMANLQAIVGRMEKFGGKDKPTVFVDYAHTPDALQKALLAAKSNGRLWLVFGCGGNRDKGKRSEMGLIAESIADQIIITDDNPRYELSEEIIKDILAASNAKNFTVINDRALAISTAIHQAGKEDCVLIAGKGHENYQEINGNKIPFSDQHIVKQTLAIWTGSHEIITE